MVSVPVTLFDYGVGNLHSIRKALEQSGADVTVTQNGEDLLAAPALALPGVGAFGATMEPLLDVRDALRDRLRSGVPCLAVCIGMQLLFEASEESPDVPGIGLLAGRVRRFPADVGKVPHMGWNTLHAGGPTGSDDPHGDAVPRIGTHVYYVHSYYAEPADPAGTLRTTRYGAPGHEVEFPAVLAHGATLATQFHPEKSSAPGLLLIARWVESLGAHSAGGGQRPNIDTPTEGSGARGGKNPVAGRENGPHEQGTEPRP